MQTEEIQAYALEVAKRLNEESKQPLEQIELLLQLAGRDFVDSHVKEAIEIEEKGGMMTEDKKRRRTLGGVFFYIVKGKLEPEVVGQIFPGYGQSKAAQVIPWEDRMKHVQPLLNAGEHGDMRYVTITLHGRPGKVVIDGDTVITTITNELGQIPMLRGVPKPPDEPTLFTVYLGLKHWEEAKESLDKYKKDRLVVEGTIVNDGESGTIAILAQRVSTKRIDKIARKEESEDGKPESEKSDKKDKRDKGKKPDPKSKKQSGKPTKPNNAKPFAPVKPERPMPTAKPVIDVDVPDGAPPETADKLRQLHSAAATLRERIAAMEEKGQAGVAMTKKLLRNTEKQIEAIEKRYTD
jgi:hypothetical protein